jgi:hypothetical protein
MAKFAMRLLKVVVTLAIAAGFLIYGVDQAVAGVEQTNTSSPAVVNPAAANPPAASTDGDQGLIIENDTQMPDTFPNGNFEVHLLAHGGVPVLHWKLEKGTLPPGIKLEESGLLHGAAEQPGEFQFTLSVTDGGKPQLAVQKAFLIRVKTGLVLTWKAAPHVNGNRIEGSVEVSNTTPDDLDLTYDVKAVAENGRATEIGYQRFPLRKGVTGKEIPFGETLPHGGYIVYVNVVGEVAAKKLILRQRMQTGGPLQVVVGP